MPPLLFLRVNIYDCILRSHVFIRARILRWRLHQVNQVRFFREPMDLPFILYDEPPKEMTGPEPVMAISGPRPMVAANPPHAQTVGTKKLSQRGTGRKQEANRTKPGKPLLVTLNPQETGHITSRMAPRPPEWKSQT